MRKTYVLSAISAIALASPSLAATAFDMEGVANGYYSPALTVTDGSATLTVTTEGFANGSVYVAGSGVPLIGKGVIGSQVNPININQFAPLRFSFNQTVNSITFNFGDAGGEDDTPVTIAAYNASNVLLGSFTDTYPSGFSTGKSATLTFAGASYYIASSGTQGNNANSIFWDITAVQFGAAVPEPASWALMLIGFGMGGAALRRRGSRPVLA